MKSLRKSRCSSLPLEMICPNAGDIAVTPVGMHAQHEARLGSGFHKLFSKAILVNECPSKDDIEREADARGVEVYELSPLVRNGWRWWKSMRDLFPNPIIERALSHGDLEGHSDLFARYNARIGHGLDWKSGFRVIQSKEQFKGYSWLWFQEDKTIEEIVWLAFYVRRGLAMPLVTTRAESDEWYANYQEHRQQDRFIQNEHCSMCTRALSCPALRGWIDMALTTLADTTMAIEGTPDALPSGEALWSAIEKAKMLRSFADRFEFAAKAALKLMGPQPVGSGLQVRMNNKGAKELIPDVCAELLLKEFGVSPLDAVKSLKYTAEGLYSLLSQVAEERGATIKDTKNEFYRLLELRGGIIQRDRFEMLIEAEPRQLPNHGE